MSENLDPQEPQTEIIRNEHSPHDSTVVVEEPHRTVVLTDEETIVIEKEPMISIAPKNRPRRVNMGMFGPTEYVVVGLGMLSLLATFLFYMFVVTPARAELTRHKDERNVIEKELASKRDKFKGSTTTEEKVAKLVASAEDFENLHLPIASNGRTALYQRLNTLIAGYGLINTSGPDYAPLEINQRQGQSETERGRAKFQSLFPGVYVSMTVEGSYQNLRRFLRDIETSQQFMIVSAVELEPTETESQPSQTTNVSQPTVDNPNQKYARPNSVDPTGAMSNPNPNNFGQMQTMPVTTQPNRPRAPRGKTTGETVSLHIEIAAYFKRNLAATPLSQ